MKPCTRCPANAHGSADLCIDCLTDEINGVTPKGVSVYVIRCMGCGKVMAPSACQPILPRCSDCHRVARLPDKRKWKARRKQIVVRKPKLAMPEGDSDE